MQHMLSRLADAPLPPAVTLVIGLVVLVLVWKLIKGTLKLILMVAIAAAILGALVWMGKVDRDDVPGLGMAEEARVEVAAR